MRSNRMATRKKPCVEATATARPGLPPVYYRLHALLESIRSLQSHEDELCTTLAEIQRSGRTGVRLQREIEVLLHGLPAMRLHAEMDACFAALEEAAA
jgi:hypothetical protein